MYVNQLYIWVTPQVVEKTFKGHLRSLAVSACDRSCIGILWSLCMGLDLLLMCVHQTVGSWDHLLIQFWCYRDWLLSIRSPLTDGTCWHHHTGRQRQHSAVPAEHLLGRHLSRPVCRQSCQHCVGNWQRRWCQFTAYLLARWLRWHLLPGLSPPLTLWLSLSIINLLLSLAFITLMLFTEHWEKDLAFKYLSSVISVVHIWPYSMTYYGKCVV